MARRSASRTAGFTSPLPAGPGAASRRAFTVGHGEPGEEEEERAVGLELGV